MFDGFPTYGTVCITVFWLNVIEFCFFSLFNNVTFIQINCTIRVLVYAFLTVVSRS